MGEDQATRRARSLAVARTVVAARRAAQKTKALVPVRVRAPVEPAEALRKVELVTRESYISLLRDPDVLRRLQALLANPATPDKQWLDTVLAVARTFLPQRPPEPQTGGGHVAVQINLPRPEGKGA